MSCGGWRGKRDPLGQGRATGETHTGREGDTGSRRNRGSPGAGEAGEAPWGRREPGIGRKKKEGDFYLSVKAPDHLNV